MADLFVSAIQDVEEREVRRASAATSSVFDFRTELNKLFNRPTAIMSSFLNSDEEEIYLDGIGYVRNDLNNAATLMSLSIVMGNIENQVSKLTSILEFINVTLPKMTEKWF